jgi:hypothetical protein
MGCGGTSSGESIKQAVVLREEVKGHSNYVHFLTENAYFWQLVMYDLNEGKFCTTTVSKTSLNPDCEVTVVNNAVYCTGGRVKSGDPSISSDVKVVWFLKGKNSVTPFASLTNPRYRHATTSLNNSTLVAIGGLGHEDKPLAACESCDINSDRWRKMPALNAPKAHLAACSFKDTSIYAFGGADDFIERLDLTQPTALWTLISFTGERPSGDPTKLWCTQATETDLIIFGEKKIALFDTTKATFFPIADVTPQYVPERRNEIKVRKSEVLLMLNASGDLGLFMLSLRKWNIKPHIALVS